MKAFNKKIILEVLMLTFEKVRKRYKKTFAYNEEQFVQRVSARFEYTEYPIPKIGYVITNKRILSNGKIIDCVNWYFKNIKEFDEYVTLLEKQENEVI